MHKFFPDIINEDSRDFRKDENETKINEFEAMIKRPVHGEVKLKRHKRNVDNLIGTLRSTQFMSELNTISKDARHKDFRNDSISSAMASQYYQKV